MTGARIISKDPGNWYNRFTINKGSRDGIQTGMNVVSDNGLVGIVISTSPSTSVVRSIIDDNSSVSGMLSKNYNTCIVSGDLTLIDSNLLDVELLSDNTSIADGDEVVTSYISDKFLPGLLIGYISNVSDTQADLSKHAQLTPAVDFEHLSNVLIIKQLQGSQTQETQETAAESETESVSETESETQTQEAGE
jgi:rod shape-determining protein MreC